MVDSVGDWWLERRTYATEGVPISKQPNCVRKAHLGDPGLLSTGNLLGSQIHAQPIVSATKMNVHETFVLAGNHACI